MVDVLTKPAITIVVHGTPAPQGSKRAFRNKHTGRIHQVESSAAVAPWRQDVKHAALAALAEHNAVAGLHGEGKMIVTPITGPVAVSMVFSFVRPKSHWRTGRNAHLLRDSAPAQPCGRPDLSKLIRSTEDALTGVVWSDDAQIVHCHAVKQYCVDGQPGAEIRVWGCVPQFDPVTGGG